jgi:hypothetical protein
MDVGEDTNKALELEIKNGYPLEIKGDIPEGCFKLLVAGPRETISLNVVVEGLDNLLHMGLIGDKDNLVIVQGTALGVDTYAMLWAVLRGVRYKNYPAKWQDLTAVPCVVGKNTRGTFNRLAGHNRNTTMRNVCDKGFIFWNGVSKGTKDMKDKLERTDKDGEGSKLLGLYLTDSGDVSATKITIYI